MSEPLILYTNPQSRGQIARWMLEEVGASYEHRIIAYGAEMASADYRHINPMAKVPALTHGKQVITECAAICTYLADIFPEAKLAPPRVERGAYYRWLFFAAGPLEQAITSKLLDSEPTTEQQAMVGFGSFDRTIDVLEAALQNLEGTRYIAADYFTAADLYLGSHLDFGLQFGTFPKRTAFVDYAARVTARPAYIRAKAIDEKLTEEAGDASTT